jgi:F-type H+-transporting ATPase subunit gamma
MASTREIRRRIRSVQSTAKITKAMELVAASKMRRSQLMALSTRPYAVKMREVIGNLAALRQPDEPLHPLLTKRPVQHVGIIYLTTDRGLAGGLNANLNRRTAALVTELRPAEVSMITVGRKGRDFFRRVGVPLRAEFTDLTDYPSVLDTLAISRIVVDDYTNGLLDEVYIAYPDFINTAVQRPEVQRLLPIEPPAAVENLVEQEYIFEPDAAHLLAQLLPRYVEMQLYHAVLELKASEQSARMVAMRNASEAAKEMIQDLTLTYNKARQEQITAELLDIVGGAAVLQA